MEAHEIVGQVHDAFPNVAIKVARLKSVSAEIIRSHHREPKTHNPLSSGNTSPVTHFIEYCHLYEAAKPGAGRLLSDRVHSSLTAEFSEGETMEQRDIETSLLTEHCDVQAWLASNELDQASPRKLSAFETECAELIEQLTMARAKARSIRRQKDAEAGDCGVRDTLRSDVGERAAV